MAPAKKSAGKSSANKAKAVKPNASAAKASTVKAGTAKANAKVKTASQPQTRTARRAEVDDGENMEIDSAEDEGIDGEGSDDVAEPKAKAQTASKVAKGAVIKAPTSNRIATRPTNANQHPGEQLNALVKRRRTKEEMIEVRRQQAEQKERKEEAARQKKVVQDKAIDRIAQFEMELANDAYNDTPLPRNRRILEGGLQFDRAVADHRESDEDYGVSDNGASGPDERGSDVIDDDEVVDAGPIDEIGSNTDEEAPAKALKRKGKAARANVDADVEMSASEGKDRPKKKVKWKAAETFSFVSSESEVEIVEVSEPEPRRKNHKQKASIRDAITDRRITDQKLRLDKVDNFKADKTRSSDALKRERYKFLTTPSTTCLPWTKLPFFIIPSAPTRVRNYLGLSKTGSKLSLMPRPQVMPLPIAAQSRLHFTHQPPPPRRNRKPSKERVPY